MFNHSRKRIVRLTLIICLMFFSTSIFADLSYEGSSTIGEGVLSDLSKIFYDETGIRFRNIGLEGSGKGFTAVVEGSADIGGLSRPLRNNEKNGNIYYQIIGYDAVVVYLNRSNPVNSLTRDQVKGIFSGTIRNWKEVGGLDESILVITEIVDGKRATIEEFRTLAMDGVSYGRTKEIDKPYDCVKLVSETRNGITFATIAFSMEGVKYISYGGISPSKENISSGAYPLSRPLILVSAGYPKGELRKFYDFIISEKGQRLVAEKFVPVRKLDK